MNAFDLKQRGNDMDKLHDRNERLLRIIRYKADCPRCGAAHDQPCLTWRGDEFQDGTVHPERKLKPCPFCGTYPRNDVDCIQCPCCGAAATSTMSWNSRIP